MTLLTIILLFLKNWWWFFLPIILVFPFKTIYLWWIRWEMWYKKQKWILLEIKPPKEILKPFRAMEDIINVLWGIYDGANWRERWCEGELIKGPYWMSFEMASIGGKIHFYMRILAVWRDMIEATIYSHYPEIEISVVDDYTRQVPQDVPNAEWDLYSEDYSTMKDDILPFKTYSAFFEERPEIIKEEKRLDPLDSLLEAMAKLKPAEQLWFQIVAAPITNGDIPWITKGKKIANQLAKRPAEKPARVVWREAADLLITGTITPPPKEEVGLIAPELRLTPGEREVLKGVENKISKQGFRTWIRIVYLYKRKEPHNRGNYKIIRSYFNHFMTENLNSLVFWGPTRTRIHYWLKERRLFLRKRKQFRNYIERLPSLFPRTEDGVPFWPFGLAPRGPGIRGTIILNSEELATLYHFPAKIEAVTPAITPIEAKKGGPPPGLPTE
ncbi:hypothetical protein AMJ50_01225 [Parcubacteria bacterium DG_74_3]|nr:MAG: hypothetical protein AMJ50_01225 [Parcubacteria bacterium DG_74_3]